MTIRSLRESLPLKWSNGSEGSTCAICLTNWGHVKRNYSVVGIIYRVSNVYVSYIYRICFEIDSGLDAAKILLFCEICKRKVHFYKKLKPPLERSDQLKRTLWTKHA